MIPEGFRDILPQEAADRREIEGIFRRIARLWGYGEVITPTLEYFDFAGKGIGESRKRAMIKLFETSGAVLSMRLEMTAPIARMVTSRFSRGDFPLRLFYVANVFSWEDPKSGRRRERVQAGAELIGGDRLMSDVEVVGLLLDTIGSMCEDDVKLSLGSVAVLDALLGSFGLGEKKLSEVRELLLAKDLVSLGSVLGEDHWAVLRKLLSMRGGPEVLTRIGEVSGEREFLKAISELAELVDALCEQGFSERVLIDFGMLRDFEYYTGVVFEGYSSSTGRAICGGGRYDKLLNLFGVEVGAVGFAIDVDSIHEVRVRRGISAGPQTMCAVVCEHGMLARGMSLAAGLRELNMPTVLRSAEDVVRERFSIRLLEKGAQVSDRVEKREKEVEDDAAVLELVKSWL